MIIYRSLDFCFNDDDEEDEISILGFCFNEGQIWTLYNSLRANLSISFAMVVQSEAHQPLNSGYLTKGVTCPLLWGDQGPWD